MPVDARAEYDKLAAELAETTPTTVTKMFGMPSLKAANGKAYAGLFNEAMVFKLGGPALAEALALPGAQAFDPMGGRPMKEWVEVPVEHVSKWPELARKALEYVQGS